MHNSFKYINLSWAVVGICENARQPLLVHIPGIDKDEATAVEHYVIGYMAFWHIAFVNEDHLVPCNDDAHPFRVEGAIAWRNVLLGHLPRC